MNKQYKEIIKHFVVYGASGIMARAVGFLMIPIYTRYLTPADYGIIELLDILLIVIGLFINMGISMSVFKFYYKYDNDNDKNRVISTAIILVFGISIIFITVGILNLKVISNLLFQSDEYTKYIKIVLLTFLFDNITNIMFSFIRAKQRSLLYSTVSIIRLFSGLSLNIYLIVIKDMGIFGVLYSGLITSCMVAILLGIYTVNKIGIRFSFHNAREMIRFGLPLVPSAVGIFIINFGDRFFLQRFSDLTELGIYSLAYKFGFLINFLIVHPFSLIWDAKMFEIEKQEDADIVYSNVFTYFVFILLFAFTSITILIKDVMLIIVSEEFFSAYKIVPFIVFAYVLSGSCYMLRVGFYLRNKTKYVGLIMVVTAIFTLAMYYILIPLLGAMGAALSTVVSFLFWNILTYIFVQGIHKVSYQWIRILKLIACSSILIGISQLIQLDSLIFESVLKSLLVISFPIILWSFSFFTVSEYEKIKGLKVRISNYFLFQEDK